MKLSLILASIGLLGKAAASCTEEEFGLCLAVAVPEFVLLASNPEPDELELLSVMCNNVDSVTGCIPDGCTAEDFELQDLDIACLAVGAGLDLDDHDDGDGHDDHGDEQNECGDDFGLCLAVGIPEFSALFEGDEEPDDEQFISLMCSNIDTVSGCIPDGCTAEDVELEDLEVFCTALANGVDLSSDCTETCPAEPETCEQLHEMGSVGGCANSCDDDLKDFFAQLMGCGGDDDHDGHDDDDHDGHDDDDHDGHDHGDGDSAGGSVQPSIALAFSTLALALLFR